LRIVHTTTGCGKQGFPSAQPYLSHTPGANPFCCMFLLLVVSYLLSCYCKTTLYSVESPEGETWIWQARAGILQSIYKIRPLRSTPLSG
ncbi:hypothetical protein BP00DRAFT_332863, partial [Aspergillus indologenus CBS 114.80]